MLQRCSRIAFAKSVQKCTNALGFACYRFFSATTKASTNLSLTSQEISDWHHNGYIVKPSLFDKEEISILKECISSDPALKQFEFGVSDDEKKKSNLVLWNRIGDDTYGNFIASQRMHSITNQLLNSTPNMVYNGDIYHYHTKLMLKHPKTGGSFIWHQDYGYWYQNYFLFPNLLTAFVAIDACTTENGCLQVIKSSHLMGRLDHGIVGNSGQTGILSTSHEKLSQGVDYGKLDLVYVTMEPGDTLFFDCNLLHRSDCNESENSRYALLAAFTTEGNLPYKEHHHEWHKVIPVNDDNIKKEGIKLNSDTTLFMNPKDDATIDVDK